ncbi:zinc-finger domain-containing protein [Rickettsiales bacterium LUAb2]
MSEIIKISSRKIACGGDEKANLGHPKIYFVMKENDNTFTCPYCGRVYQYISSTHKEAKIK